MASGSIQIYYINIYISLINLCLNYNYQIRFNFRDLNEPKRTVSIPKQSVNLKANNPHSIYVYPSCMPTTYPPYSVCVSFMEVVVVCRIRTFSCDEKST